MSNTIQSQLPQGPGWSPAGGEFWVRGNFIYWSDGDVGDLRLGQGPCSVGFGNYEGVEDFSAWTDEHRAEVKKSFAKRRDEWARQAAEAEAARIKLVESARKKLTEEEFLAVVAEGRC